MLIKATDVLNLKVISLNEGSEIERVDDVVYDPETNKIRALLVDEGGWFSDAKVILFEDIESIGHDAVMVRSSEVIKKASEVPDTVSHIAHDETYLTKTKIITRDGTQLGEVSDVLFENTTGDVQELEVSQGGLKNLQSGKKRVMISDIVTIGKDATIVSNFTPVEFEAQAQEQGLQGMYNKGKDLAAEGTAQAKAKFVEVQDTATDPVVQAKARRQAQSVVDQANQTIEDINDRVRAEFNEFTQDPQTQQAIQQVKDTAAKVTTTVKKKARQATDATKTTAAQAKKNVTKKMKDNALGRYLTINVLGENDKLIAKRGDMVTHSILEKGENQGLLDQIVTHVSEQPVG